MVPFCLRQSKLRENKQAFLGGARLCVLCMAPVLCHLPQKVNGLAPGSIFLFLEQARIRNVPNSTLTCIQVILR